MFAGHLHSARPGPPAAPARQQVQDRDRPCGEDQPAGIRPEASIPSRAEGHAEAGAGQAEARVEQSSLARPQAGGSPETDMSGTWRGSEERQESNAERNSLNASDSHRAPSRTFFLDTRTESEPD